LTFGQLETLDRHLEARETAQSSQTAACLRSCPRRSS
jgi:hypothetical protein